MYARYVPPPKATTPIPESPRPAIETPSITSVKSQPTAYARYIPPPKPTSSHQTTTQHVHFEEGNAIDEPPAKKVRIEEEEEEEENAPKESKKKSKKPKRSKNEAQPSEGAVDGLDNNDPVMRQTDRDSVDSDEAPPQSGTADQEIARDTTLETPSETNGKIKKDKKNKKKIKKSSDDQALEEVEDKTPVRHRSVLEKAAKSIRAPESQPDADLQKDIGMQDAPDGAETKTDDAMDVDVNADVPEVHGLQPLPQPKPVIPDATKPAYDTLPPWLAKPIRVSPQATAPFTEFGLSLELGISPEAAEKLATSGYKQAFAIQTAVIPLLLPHHDKTMHGDVLVSAATGSGKTLAYALPVVRDLSQGNRHLTRLRAVIVLPTRELVRQVQQVFEQCAGAFSLNGSKKRVRVGIAMGSQSIEQEQAAFIEREEKYDPEAYAKRNRRLASNIDEESDGGYNTEDEERAGIRKREDKIQTLPDHVITYHSKVDILISTPGRLVEHIKYTPGFSLDFVRWLVVDEADKLLGQNFQQWLEVVIPRLQSNENNSRNHKQSNLSGVRKIVLSATMTRDLDRLEGLKLRWPKLVMLEGSGIANEAEVAISQAELVLPELLEEAALKVSDPNLKPLFLVDLLQSNYILGQIGTNESKQDPSDDDTSSSGSDSESESDADSGLETSFKPPRVTPPDGNTPSVLIFTKSNETALRLSRLLSLLSPSLGSLAGTLTSTTQYATRRRTIRSFLAGKLRILGASDLVARGIDLPSLDHVINYDMPSSIASYVHRVGRTARAGKTGKAWTLFTNPEARWFWNEVASETTIQRKNKVERIRVTEEKEDAFEKKVAAYELALAKLGEEASESRNRAR
ncbi:P-loop containing nucleoside triphosphate hydrolase protein [Hypoxylon trugodes]|uniref:P-loop containing nucleoside triphosphate hydrolase protein n=1 Tax=Hypoxylon trugodes TaxID=326681 RepID=UPI00218D03BB|nr:P-loop containing nucleoside triphosphate hydrolase protein [Hypoxylon trugodes]KAI1382815.1 P-loop containing nucleoside triphosphate hydrolase protein [Hypoxylon trugodes]